MSSLFTKIIKGEIQGSVIHEDEHCAALLDIKPAGPKHFLIVPKKEIRSLDTATPEDQMLLGHLLLVAARLARKQGFAERGYRVVINTNEDAGQTVWHLHVHLIGGRELSWPPG